MSAHFFSADGARHSLSVLRTKKPLGTVTPGGFLLRLEPSFSVRVATRPAS
jgi:hypothetical protein